MAAESWRLYDAFMLAKNDGTIDFANDVFKVALLSDLYVPNQNTDAEFTDGGGNYINTNELAQANGYTTGGEVTTVTLSQTAGNINLAGTNVGWVANGGSIVPSWAVLYNVDNNVLVAFSMLDNVNVYPTPEPVYVTDTNAYNINIETNDIYDEAQST